MSGLVDAHAAAEHLGVSVFWVREQTRQGVIPYVPLGKYLETGDTPEHPAGEFRAWPDSIPPPARPTQACTVEWPPMQDLREAPAAARVEASR